MLRHFLTVIPKWSSPARNLRQSFSNTDRFKDLAFLPRVSGSTIENVQYCICRQYSNTRAVDDLIEGVNDEAKQEVIPRDPEKDRTKVTPVEVSIRYMQSSAYKQTYGDNNVWVLYRRNFKGQFAPKRTRKNCVRKGIISTGSPCPICRDEYLTLDYRNERLLKQFISPFNGEVLSSFKTGLCRFQHSKLIAEIEKAKEHGTLLFDAPFREYNYDEYKAIHESYKNQ